MKRSRGAVFPSGGAKAEQGQDAAFGTSEVAQLSTRQGLVSQIVVAVDVFIPQSGVGAAQDRLQMQAGQLVHGSGQQRLWCAAESVLDWARASLRVARGRQLQQPLPMHAQHGHPAAHLLEATVRLEPAQELAGQAGELGPRAGRIFANQLTQSPHLPAAKVSPAEAFHPASAAGVLAQVNARARWGLISQGRKGSRSGGGCPPCLAQACR